MKKQIIVLLLVSVLFLSSVQPAMAQFEMPSSEDIIRTIVQFIFGNDYPASWLETNNFLQLIIFPLIALFAVFYGIFTELRIFGGQTNTKFVISLMFSLGGGWFALSSMKGFMMVNATLATWGFGIVLLLGIVFWAARRISDGVFDLTGRRLFSDMEKRGHQQEELSRLRAERAQWFDAHLRAMTYGDTRQAKEFEKKLKETEEKIKELEKETYKWLRNPTKMS